MASSTTMPIASTSPNNEMLFRLKPSAAMTANVPISETGTSIRGIKHRLPILQEEQHDNGH